MSDTPKVGSKVSTAFSIADKLQLPLEFRERAKLAPQIENRQENTTGAVVRISILPIEGSDGMGAKLAISVEHDNKDVGVYQLSELAQIPG